MTEGPQQASISCFESPRSCLRGQAQLERESPRNEGGLTSDCVYVHVCLGTTLSDRADEVARLAGAVWIMSDIKSEAVLESRHYGA